MSIPHISAAEWNKSLPEGGQDFSSSPFYEQIPSGIGANNKFGHLSDYSYYNFTSCHFRHTDCSRCQFIGCTFDNVTFMYANFRRCRFFECSLVGTRIVGTNFRQCEFDSCEFSGVSLQDVEVDQETDFKGCIFFECSISIRVLEDLGPKRGSLTDGQLRDLKIVDVVADLRREFSGFQGWVYLVLGAIAFGPYVWFVISQLRLANIGEALPVAVPSSPVLVNLLRFILSGGRTWQEWDFASFSFFSFVYSTIFNSLRLALLWKTKQLEHHRLISGFTPVFSTSGLWGRLISWHNIMKYGIVVVVVVHTIHFLMIRVPLNPVPSIPSF